MESTDTLTDLAGEANYLTIDIRRGVVTVDAVDLIDSKFWTVEHSEPKKEVVIADLTEKSRDGIFYRAILAYEKDHRRDILSHTKGTLTEEEQEKFEKEEKHHEKEMKKRKEKEEREKREREQKEHQQEAE